MSLNNLSGITAFLLFLVAIAINLQDAKNRRVDVNTEHTNKTPSLTCEYDIDPELSDRVINASFANPLVRQYENDYYEVECYGGNYYLIKREDADEDYDHFLDGPELMIIWDEPYNKYREVQIQPYWDL